MRCGHSFTYGVDREGVIAESFLQNSAKVLQTFRRISAPFPDAISRISANFPQNFAKKKPFANDPISQLLIWRNPDGYRHYRVPKCKAFRMQKVAILKPIRFDTLGAAKETPNPKGPKIEKIQSRLKFSIPTLGIPHRK